MAGKAGGSKVKNNNIKKAAPSKKSNNVMRKKDNPPKSDFYKVGLGITALYTKYADLYDLVPVGYFTMDKNGVILEANLTGSALLNVERSRLIKMHFSHFIHKDDQDIFVLHRKKTLENKSRQTCELMIAHSNGYLYAQIISIAEKDNEGQFSRIHSVVSDITERRSMEEALSRKKNEFEGIFNSINDAVAFASIERKIIMINPAFTRMFGYTEEEAIGKSTEILYPDRESFVKAGKDIYLNTSEGSFKSIEIKYRRKDGTMFDAETRASRVRDHDGNVIGFFAIHRDITERKRIEESLEEAWRLTRKIADTTPDIIYVFDIIDHYLVYVNNALAKTLGYTLKDIQEMGESLYTSIIHPEDLSKVLETIALCKMKNDEDIVNLDFRVKNSRGDWLWLSTRNIIFSRTGDGLPREILGIAHDITGLQLATEERERLLQDLTRSNRDLEQFAYIASHDLQEPLRMITSYIRLISDRYKGRLDEDADEFIDYAVNGANHMKALLNDMLAYSRVGTHGERFELIDLNVSVQTAVGNLRKIIENGGAEIKHGSLPKIFADKVQMVQVFQNFIDNAIKFCGSNPPRIHINAEWKITEWVIGISDNCIGIDPKHFDRIFLMFKRLQPGRQYPGTGVGLAVCKKIVERHGGRIWVESVPGKGSTFYFTIPAMDKTAEKLIR